MTATPTCGLCFSRVVQSTVTGGWACLNPECEHYQPWVHAYEKAGVATSPLGLGDVIVKPIGSTGGYRVFIVTGWTRQGKIRLHRLHASTELRAWWRDRTRLPRDYRYIGTVPESFLETL